MKIGGVGQAKKRSVHGSVFGREENPFTIRLGRVYAIRRIAKVREPAAMSGIFLILKSLLFAVPSQILTILLIF